MSFRARDSHRQRSLQIISTLTIFNRARSFPRFHCLTKWLAEVMPWRACW